MEIKIQTLTPLWTGGVDGSMDRIHETSIIGSMRWWYEAIVRGLGGSACDPISHECPDKDARYCDSCALFGTTGFKRLFRIDWPTLQNAERDEQLVIRVNNNRGWYLKRGLFEKEFCGRFLPTRQLKWTKWDNTSQILALVLKLVSEWGGLGARTQQGYSVVEVETDPELNIDKALQFIEETRQRSDRNVNMGKKLPKIDDFFFSKIRFSSSDPWAFFDRKNAIQVNSELSWYRNNRIVPLSSLTRYYFRRFVRERIQYDSNKSNSAARWQIMGVMKARYHRPDFGKVKDIEWRCYKCKRSWSSKPLRDEHLKCNGRAQPSKWRCESCNTIWKASDEIEKDTCTVERHRSLINISNAYCVGKDLYEFRIWGWIPQSLSGNLGQRDMMKKLIDWLGIRKDDRQWQGASLGELWGKSCMNLSQPQILWYARKSSETPEDFLRALLTPGDTL